jgi:hypothetical protein
MSPVDYRLILVFAQFANYFVLLEKAEEYNLPNDLRCGDWRKLDNTKIEKIINWLRTDQKNTYT